MVLTFGSRRCLLLLLSYVLSTAAQNDLICGTQGYHDETNTSWYMSNAFYNGLTSFTLCSSYCQKDSRCEAFRYSYWSDADSQYCEFFDTNIFTNFTVDNTSPYYYYDVGCAFPPFEDPITVTSISTLAAITVTSIRFATIISTLPAVTRTSTVAGAAVTITQTATSVLTSTQTLLAQIRTVTASYTATATAYVYLTTTQTTYESIPPQTSTVYYPVTTTALAQARTVTATYTASVTAYVSVTSTRTLPAQTSTIYYAITSTASSTAVYYITTTLTATVTAQAQPTQAPPPPPPQTITRFSTRIHTSTTTDIRYLRTVTTTRRVC